MTNTDLRCIGLLMIGYIVGALLVPIVQELVVHIKWCLQNWKHK